MSKVFVVEDELLVALVYSQFLTKNGYQIIGPFTTGKQALKELVTEGVCAILLDIQLDDEISGIEIAERFREKSTAPIIFTTGNNVSKTIAQTEHISNVIVLAKPVNTQELLQVIKG